MTRIPPAPDLLDDDLFDTPSGLTAEDFFMEGGPGWRRRADPSLETEDDR